MRPWPSLPAHPPRCRCRDPFSSNGLLGAFALVAAVFLIFGDCGRALLAQSLPFQLVATNSAPNLLPGKATWIDSNSLIMTSAPINWGGGMLQVNLGTNADFLNDRLEVAPLDTNLQVQGSQLHYQGVLVGTILEQDWHPSYFLGRLNPDGGLDASFSAPADHEVASLALQSDGKILVGGAFQTVAGQQRVNLARLNADGSLDNSFNPAVANPAGSYSEVYALALQQDGKILVGGYFTALAGQARSGIGRLNPDGSLDTQFNPGVGSTWRSYTEVDTLVQDASGRVLIGGLFDTLGGQSRTNLARLNPDGTLDSLFNPAPTGYRVDTLALQANGQILVGGSFDTLAAVFRANLGRLNADGSLDLNFNPGPSGSGAEVFSVVPLPGQTGAQPILVGGAFATLAGQARLCLGRLNSDGSLDTNFNSGIQGPLGDQKVNALALQADGRILIGGQFDTWAGVTRNNIARLNSDGSLDTAFNPGVRFPSGVGSSVAVINALAVQPDGKIIVGGTFLELGEPRLRISFSSAATTEAVTAVLRALTLANDLEPRTLEGLANPQPALGLTITLTDGSGNEQIVAKSIQFSYLVDLKFEPDAVYVTGTVDARSVLECALNTAPGTFVILDGYQLTNPLIDCASSFDASSQTVYVGTDDVQSDSVCTLTVQVGTLSAQLDVNRLAEDQCAVDLFEGITWLQNSALRRRAPRQTSGTLVSAASFRALETLMNQTSEGQRLANLYRQNTAELVGIMLRNPSLLEDTLSLVQSFQPGVASLLAGDGSSFSVTAAMVRQVQTLASQFASLGSTNLRAAIQSETSRLNNFNGFVGRNFNGWAATLGVNIPTNAFVQANVVRTNRGQFTVEANALDGLSYSLWRAPDLAGSAWTHVTNAILAQNGFTVDFTDPAAPLGRAFYRVGVVPVAPTVLTAPYPSTQLEGANLSLSVVASGFHLGYQWQFNGEDIPGATTSTLTLPHLSRCQEGLYNVQVSNGGGIVTSAPAFLSVTPHSFELVSTGLVAHLPFDGDYHDVSGNGYDGAVIGATALIPGLVGAGAMRFNTHEDGSSFNYISLGTNLAKRIATNDFSVAFWVNLTNLSADLPLLSNADLRNSTNAGFTLVVGRYGYLLLTIADGSGVAVSSQSQLPIDGAWHHVAVTCQRKGLAEVYVNGLLTQQSYLPTLSGSIDSGLPLNIGQDGLGNYVSVGVTGTNSGIVDDVGIWQTALTPAQVAALYFQGSEGLSFDKLPSPPSIFSQPCSQAVTEGLNAVFTVIGLGTNLNYGWRANGAKLGNATNGSLTLSNVQLSQAGVYTVVLANAFGSVTSTPAILTVNPRPSYVLTNGLLAHLPFDGGYNDVSGGGFNGSAIGMPALAAGKVGTSALSFTTAQNGSSFNYLTLGTNLVNEIATNDFSASFWINIANFGGNPALLANESWANPSSPGLTFAVGNGGVLNANVSIGTGVPLAVTGGGIADGNWHHVAMTYLRGRLAVLYQDGQPMATTPLFLAGNLNSGLPLNLGQDGTGHYSGVGSTGITNALLDDLGIWQRSLDRREVEFIYLQGRDGQTFDK